MTGRRRRAALLFALAGAAAAAVHVLSETDGAWREWRQTAPLAVAVGAALGAFGFRSDKHGLGHAALAGAAHAAGAFLLFAAAFALGHGLIEALRGDPAPAHAAFAAFGRALDAGLGPTGAAAAGFGALAGLAAAALRRHERD